MLHRTNRNDGFQRNTAFQHCYGQLQDCFNIAILSCEKIVVANCPLSIKSIIEVLQRLLCTIDLTWLYSFLLYYQTSSSRRSSLSSLPQPLLNAVRPKQESLEPFPVTWAQKVALNCSPSPTKRPSESRQRVVSSSSAYSLQSRLNNNPWCESAGLQSERGLYFKLVSTPTLLSNNSVVVRSPFGHVTIFFLTNLVRSRWLDVGFVFFFSFLLTLTLGEYLVFYLWRHLNG